MRDKPSTMVFSSNGESWITETTQHFAPTELDFHKKLEQDPSELDQSQISYLRDVDTPSEPDAEWSYPPFHYATRNHPFLDMSSGNGARVKDATKMQGYYAETKPPSPYLGPLTGDRTRIPRAVDLGIDQLRNSKFHQFSLIIGSSFGVIRENVPYQDPWTGYEQQALIQKMVPSGGSRHPAECILKINSSPDISSGRYVFDISSNELVQISTTNLDEKDSSSDGGEWDIEIDTCMMVERAMYRYRDPRSFRALFVDAGHIDGQLAATAGFVNWAYSSSLAVQLNYSIGQQNIPKDGLIRVLSSRLTS